MGTWAEMENKTFPSTGGADSLMGVSPVSLSCGHLEKGGYQSIWEDSVVLVQHGEVVSWQRAGLSPDVSGTRRGGAQ